MAIRVGQGFLEIIPKLSQQFGRDVQAQAGPAMARVGQNLKSAGLAMSATVTPLAVGMGVAFKKAFEEFDTGADTIRASTGATGKALVGLTDSMKRVGGQVVEPLSQVGQVMGELAQRTDLTGKPLEKLTKQVLELSRLTGTDAQTNVASLTRLFGDWSVTTDLQSSTLDKLYRLTQTSGIGIDRLSELMVQFGSPLRALGLDMDTTAAMFARFEKEGVNIQTAMPGLRQALRRFAKSGQEPAAALQDTIERIRNMRSEGEAMSLSMKTFGARAGADVGRAIREGRFELDSYIKSMKEGSDTTGKAVKDTLDLSDHFKMLKNRIQGAIGPFGEVGSGIASAVAAIGPMVFGIGSLTTALQGSAVASRIASIAMSSLPFVAIGVAVVALAYIIYRNWSTIKKITLAVFGAVGRFFSRTFGGIKNAVVGVIDWVKKNWPTLLAVFTGPIGLAVKFVVDHFDTIKKKAKAIFSGLVGIIKGAANGIVGALNAVIRLVEKFINVQVRAYNKIADAPIIGRALPHMSELHLPRIPKLARGGHLDAGQLGLVGEDGAEFIRAGRKPLTVIPNRAVSGLSGDIRVPVYLDGRIIAEVVTKRQREKRRRDTALGLA